MFYRLCSPYFSNIASLLSSSSSTTSQNPSIAFCFDICNCLFERRSSVRAQISGCRLGLRSRLSAMRGMGTWIVPSLLRPDFTWPRPMPSRILKTTPPTPSTPSKIRRISWGVIYKPLYHFSSRWYCSWFGIAFDANIVQLPFGLSEMD